MAISKTSGNSVSMRLSCAVVLLTGLACLAGCAMRRSAKFVSAGEVRRVKIMQQGQDVRTIENPQQIAQVSGFLDSHRKGWSPIWDTPWVGEYTITLETDDSFQTVFINDGMIQTNSEGVPLERALSAAEQQQLLALIGSGGMQTAQSGVATGPVEQAGFSTTE